MSSTNQTLEEQFEEFHSRNPGVYDLFEKFTFEAINKGHKRISHWLIANRVRWETQINTTGNPYKISNDFIGLYARMFVKKYPKYANLFQFKFAPRLLSAKNH
jgi:hypothetical protein